MTFIPNFDHHPVMQYGDLVMLRIDYTTELGEYTKGHVFTVTYIGDTFIETVSDTHRVSFPLYFYGTSKLVIVG